MSTMQHNLERFAQRGLYPAGLRTIEIEDPDQSGRHLPIDIWYPGQLSSEPRTSAPDAEHPLGFQHDAF